MIRRDRHFFANQTHHDVVRAFLQRVRPGPDPRTGFVDIEFEHGRRTDAMVAAGWLSGGREYATTPSADPFRLPRPIRSTALARFGLDFDDGAAHARAALAVIEVHRELAAEFLRGETREKVLVAVGAALLPGAEPAESRKAVKGLFCATEMDGTYSAWRTRNDIPEDRSLGQGPIALGGGETFHVRELFRQQSLRTQWLAEQLTDLHETVGYWNLHEANANPPGGATDPARTLKSDVVSELEAVSRTAKWNWACATGRAVISLQHDGVVIVPLPRDHGNEEELRRDLRRVSSAALGYDQPVEIKPMTDGTDPNPVRGKLAPAWATNLGACVAGRVGPQEAVAGEHALRPTPSETLVRAGLLPIVDGVLWVAADARQWQQLRSGGRMTALNPAREGPGGEVTRLWRRNCLLRATRCRLRAIRWAQATPGGGGAVVMIDEIAVSRSFGAEAVIDVHTTEGMKRCGLAADSKLGQTWREDLAVMLAVPGLSRGKGHVIQEWEVASLALPVRSSVDDSGEAAVEMSDGEVLMTADTTRLSRYNDEVAAAYRTTVAFEEMMRNRAPGRAPQRPTLILATDASTVMGTEMGVVQCMAGRGGPLGPEDLASMRAADLDELNVAAPEGIGGPVWVYFLDDKGGFRADWVLVWATPHPGSGLTRAHIQYVGRVTQHNEPGWGAGFCGVTCRGEQNRQPGRSGEVDRLVTRSANGWATCLDLENGVMAIPAKGGSGAGEVCVDGRKVDISMPPEEWRDPLEYVVRKTVRWARQLTTMQPRKRRAVGVRLRKWAGTSIDEILEAAMSVARERPHEQARGAGAAMGRERVTRGTTEAPAPQTEDAVSTLLSAAAFAVARHIQTLGEGEGAATLEMDCPRAPTVCPCVNGGQCTLGRAGTVLGDHYTKAVAGLQGPVADGWAGVRRLPGELDYACICGETFPTRLRRDIHVRAAKVGEAHDIPPEARPRLAAAYILVDADALSPYEAGVAAGASRMATRGDQLEHSTSSEQRALLDATRECADAIPDGAVVVGSTDSDAMRRAFLSTCHRSKSVRDMVRTSEAGVLREQSRVIDGYNDRGIDFAATWEQAYHNRGQRQRWDGRTGLLARLNHGCDLLAGHYAQHGRSRELDFYGAMEPQEMATYYYTGGGRPLFGDPYKQIGERVEAVKAQRLLQEDEDAPSPGDRRATLLLRLGADGKVDLEATAGLRRALPGPLLEEAMRAALGRMSCTASELQAQGGPDAEAIRRAVRLEGARPRAACHLCEGGPDTRAHFRYGCAACKTELGGVAMERSAHLAAMADSLWFAPGCRLPVNGGAAGRRGAGVWRQLQAFEMGKDPTVLTVHTGGLRHGMTPERATCLAAVWASRTWPGAQRLPAAAVRVCSEAVRERGRGPLRIVAQIVPELRAWLRDAFGLRGEALTSALTMSTLFETAPRVVGGAWSGGEWGVEVDDVTSSGWELQPWPHNVLVTVNEHGRGALARVYKKAVTTAEAGGRVVMVMQEAPREGEQKSCRAYQNLSNTEVAVDVVLFFPAGTIAFGHAAGWTNATESAYANTHAWAGGGEAPLRPPRCRRPGVLRRHARLMNPRASARQSAPLRAEEGRRG